MSKYKTTWHDIAKAILRKEEFITEEQLIEQDKQDIQEFSRSQLDALARQYSDLKGKTISIDNANKLRKIFDKIPNHFLNDLRKKHIPFLSGLALSRMVQKGIPVREEVDLEEGVEVQITLKGSGPINKRSHVHDFKSKADAEKWIKWYKTGGSSSALMPFKKNEVDKIEIHETAVPADYLKSKLNTHQINNIKNTWKSKKASDVTPAVKAMIKKMDIPTQLAIKAADIPHISKLVEDMAVRIKNIKMPPNTGGEVPNSIIFNVPAGKDPKEVGRGILKRMTGKVPTSFDVVKEDASDMVQAKAAGTQKRIADLTTNINDKEDRARNINPGDKNKVAIHKADINHMKLKLSDLKDKLRTDRHKRAMAAQNEPETDTSGKPNKKKEITENE